MEIVWRQLEPCVFHALASADAFFILGGIEMKKFLLAVLVVSAIVCVSVSAEIVDSGFFGENVTWTLDEMGTMTVESTDYSGIIEEDSNGIFGDTDVGARIKYLIIEEGITEISSYAFYCCENIEGIELPNSLQNIDWHAFANCINLREVHLPDECLIDCSAFVGCSSLKKITVSQNNLNYYSDKDVALYDRDKTELIAIAGGIDEYAVLEGAEIIGDKSFWKSNISKLTIPESITKIGRFAFYQCFNLKSINLPRSIANVEPGAFAQCPSLERIDVSSENIWYSSDEKGVLFNKDKTILIACPGYFTEYEIPKGVLKIGECSFYSNKNLKGVTISDGVTDICNSAFEECDNLKTITISKSVQNIEDDAFFYCVSLNEILFEGSKDDWKKIDINNNVDNISDEIIIYDFGMEKKNEEQKNGENEKYQKDSGAKKTRIVILAVLSVLIAVIVALIFVVKNWSNKNRKQ